MALSRLFDIPTNQLKEYPRKDAMAYKADGKWQTISTQEMIHLIDRMAAGLIDLGIEKGDKVVIMAPTCYQWMICDLAILKIGGVVVPIYDTILPTDIAYILEQTNAKKILVHDQATAEKLAEALSMNGQNIEAFLFETNSTDRSWKSLQKEPQSFHKERFELIDQTVQEDDLATIIYTSGTTGRPKGVMLSHKNIVSNVFDISNDYYLEKGGAWRALSFLPLSHIFERTTNYFYLFHGIGIYYAEALDKIGMNAQEVKPHTFSAVPRLIEKVYEKINSVAMQKGIIVRSLFQWAVRLGKDYDPQNPPTGFKGFQLMLARKIVFSKWRAALGNQIKFIAVGSAATQPMLLRLFAAAELILCEAYGMTETSPGITMNIPSNIMVGSVGQSLGQVKVKIEEDGEIMAKGPNVMMGYYKNEKATKEVLTDDGWIHTGDVGRLDEEGFLYITDRKKELFKTSGGKYIAPQLIENKFKESPFIEQIMVIGEGRKFPAALIVPSFEQLVLFCDRHKIDSSDPIKMLENPKILRLFEDTCEEHNQHFAKWEKIKKFALVADGWNVENGLTTPTLKLKRKAILACLEHKVEAIYDV